MGEVMSDYIAIGDIHGDIKKLQRLLAAVETLYNDQKIVFLGDYVDKGPNSKEVIDLLLEVKFKYKSKCVFLIGNHDISMLNAYNEPQSQIARAWINKMYGHTTLTSYGWDGAIPFNTNIIPDNHIEFLDSCTMHFETSELFFCHAGANITKPLNEQNDIDLLWSRPREGQEKFHKTIIHGHTPTTFITRNYQNRINLDLGVGDGYDIGCALLSKDGEIIKSLTSGKLGVTIKDHT